MPDLDQTLKALEGAGAKITTPARDVAGLFKLAFVDDPWGTPDCITCICAGRTPLRC